MVEQRFSPLIPNNENIANVNGNASGIKTILPQIWAAFIVSTYGIVCGIGYAYSAILIPQIQQEYAFDNSSSINLTESDCAWIASILPIMISIGSVAAGILIDRIGRLNTLKLSTIPKCIGWILIATAKNIAMLLIGRMLIGISLNFAISSMMVYVTEISRDDIRGSMTALNTTMSTIGMLIVYLLGWLLHWRLIAWIAVAYAILSITVISLILPESAQWLISKGRTEMATKSLKWFNKYNTSETNMDSMIEKSTKHLLKRTEQPNKHYDTMIYLRYFTKSTVYKPLVILVFLYAFQSFSGIYITLFYAVSFFQEVGCAINPFVATILMGGIRSTMSIVSLWLMKKFGRRPLILTSALGMAITMAISGYYTKLISEGTSSHYWIPLVMVLLYTLSTTIGFSSLPLTMIGELFPLPVRGITSSIGLAMFSLSVFTSTRIYYNLKQLFGGSSGLQYFFSAISLSGFIYCYIFLPETHKKELHQIEKHFEENTTYLAVKYRKSSNDGTEMKQLSTKSLP